MQPNWLNDYPTSQISKTQLWSSWNNAELIFNNTMWGNIFTDKNKGRWEIKTKLELSFKCRLYIYRTIYAYTLLHSTQSTLTRYNKVSF